MIKFHLKYVTSSVIWLQNKNRSNELYHIYTWMHMPLISSNEAKNAYFISGENTNEEIYIFSLHKMK